MNSTPRRAPALSALMLIAAGVALTGCAAPKYGTVIEQDYDPSYTLMVNQCSAYDKNGSCTMQHVVPQYHPERWSLKIEDGQSSGWRGVDQPTYHSCQVGEQYPDCASPDGSGAGDAQF